MTDPKLHYEACLRKVLPLRSQLAGYRNSVRKEAQTGGAEAQEYLTETGKVRRRAASVDIHLAAIPAAEAALAEAEAELVAAEAALAATAPSSRRFEPRPTPIHYRTTEPSAAELEAFPDLPAFLRRTA